MVKSARMDSVGLLAAWITVASLFFAVVAAVILHILGTPLERWWAGTSKPRSQARLRRLLASQEAGAQTPGTAYIAELVQLYGSAILNLVAAIGVVLLSIVLLDLGPALLAAAFPFNIDAKLLVRGLGILMLILSYFFIFRLSYLGVQIRRRVGARGPADTDAIKQEIARLSDRLK